MDYSKYIVAVVALIFVLSLIGIISILLKKYSGNFIAIGKKPSERRLKVVEILPIDGGRKLAILRRDDVEHLVLIANNNSGGNIVLEKFTNKENASE